ncbi:MAG: redoxin domain-containing protein, partial [Candidatus Eremiobacteraeota bacterium]|nr:redoxin domain-containing protein [Candidatus Eremiobacteraeota bacterium]
TFKFRLIQQPVCVIFKENSRTEVKIMKRHFIFIIIVILVGLCLGQLWGMSRIRKIFKKEKPASTSTPSSVHTPGADYKIKLKGSGFPLPEKYNLSTTAEGFSLRKQRIGNKVPDFSLADMDGNIHRLSDHKGKVVVVIFWQVICVVQQRYDSYLSEMYNKWKKQGVELMVIDSNRRGPMDSDEAIRKRIKDYNITFPILRDDDQKVADLFGALITPHAFVIDRKGRLVYEGAITNIVPLEEAKAAGVNPKHDFVPREEYHLLPAPIVHDINSPEAYNFVEKAIQAAQNNKLPVITLTQPYGCSVERGTPEPGY